MTRPSRAAAQCLDSLWITDEVLTDAFNRFARVSHTHTCRRYGSNVPGPLEARRRLARRRMALASVAASSGPPGPDLGALFGFGSGQPLPMENSWKWQAPSVQVPPIGAGPPPPPVSTVGAWSWANHQRKKPPAQVQRPSEHLRSAKDPVMTSKDAFRELLASVKSEKEIDKEDMAMLVDFLQTSADEPEARNTFALTQWLEGRAITDAALKVLAQGIFDKVTLRTLSTKQLPPALSLLVERGVTADVGSCLTRILEALPETGRSHTILKVSRSLRHATVEELEVARSWLRVLNACSYMQGIHYNNPIWRSVYQQVAHHVKMVDLAEHLGALQPLDFAQVILQYWLPHHMPEEEPSTLNCHNHMSLSFRRAKALAPELIASFEALRKANDCVSEKLVSRPTDNPLVDLLVTLRRHHVPCDKLMYDIFAVLKQTKNPLTVWGISRAINQHPGLGVTRRLAVDLIQYFTHTGDARDVRRAWLIFKNVPIVSLLDSFDLPMKLIEHGYGTPDRIYFMLNRKVGEELPVPDEREPPRLALMPEHVDLVHLVAYAWASQERQQPDEQPRGSRAAFRRVWECYRFLQDRGAPLSALMSRAMVKSGILRPLNEGKHVPLAQTKYIISLVQRLEGDHIAQNLDRLVFDARTRNRPPRGWDTLWAGRLDVGIVRAIEWRLRPWTKKQSSPWFDAGGVVDKSRTKTRWIGHRRLGKPVPAATGESASTQTGGLATLRTVKPDSPDLEIVRREVDEMTWHDRYFQQAGADLAEEDDDAGYETPLPQS